MKSESLIDLSVPVSVDFGCQNIVFMTVNNKVKYKVTSTKQLGKTIKRAGFSIYIIMFIW